MKIEIFEMVGKLIEPTTGCTCFHASEHITKVISNEPLIQGVVLIDNTPIKFSFSPYAMDGDILTLDGKFRTLIAYLIPLYVYENMHVRANRVERLKREYHYELNKQLEKAERRVDELISENSILQSDLEKLEKGQ